MGCVQVADFLYPLLPTTQDFHFWPCFTRNFFRKSSFSIFNDCGRNKQIFKPLYFLLHTFFVLSEVFAKNISRYNISYARDPAKVRQFSMPLYFLLHTIFVLDELFTIYFSKFFTSYVYSRFEKFSNPSTSYCRKISI